MAELIDIFLIDPVTFSTEIYQESDISLLNVNLSESVFNSNTDYVEFYIYDLNNNILNSSVPFTDYSILDNELYIDPNIDVTLAGFDQGTVNVVYNFYQTLLSSSTSVYYYIKEISPNRTELRLASTTLTLNEISSSVTEYVNFRNSQSEFEDFYLNFGDNFTVIANNILLDVVGTEATVLIKLYEPLPNNIGLKDQLWVVDKISDSLAYQLLYIDQVTPQNLGIPISGPNFNLAATSQLNNSTEFANLENYTSASVSQSQYQVNSYFNKPGVEINIDYSNFENFVNFSSAYARVENFFTKVTLIQSASAVLDSLNSLSATSTTINEISSLNNFIDLTITNFDGYEYYLYFESSSTTFPKSNTEAPFENVAYNSVAAQTWVTASLVDAAEYDEFNNNYLRYAIPEYIRNDVQNDNYMTFVNMVGQFFDDNVWVYIKDITNKYDADNRLDYGVSKDLVAQILRDFGVKLYQNNYSDFDLYSAFIGTTASGSLFPFPYMTGSLPTPTGYEYVNTAISASDAAVPIDDVNKRIYKRLYNNLPYLLKKKGTLEGLRALINVYGVPDSILRISEFGGKDKINNNDWDLWYDQFDYKFATNTNGWVDSEWRLNGSWSAVDDRPGSLQFRFQTPDLNSGITRPSQSLWSTEDGGTPQSLIVLEYTGSGFTSGSFSGSAPDPYNEFATLKLIPDFQNNPNISASVYLPFFDGNWWSVMVNRDNNDFTLYAADNIYDGWDGSTIGFISSSSVNVDSSPWASSTDSYFPSDNRNDIPPYEPFSGSYQEIRYFTTSLPVGVFADYVMNPQSIEGNGVNSGSEQLAFRASLGGELYTGSVSIHPKVTGSWIAINSFVGATASNFNINNGEFATNRGTTYYDSPPVGIRNRNTDKIKRYETILPPDVYGVSAMMPLPNSNVLSSQISVQQSSFISESYTNNINLLEVAFSPQNEINDDIINSIGFFDYGDYIGDPRLIPSRSTEYPSLVQLRDQYFLKYIKNYDLTDFVRLIKFFDNSLFKMVKDYVPARTSIATGIVIKQHLLERQKYPLPQSTIETPQGAYSSSASLTTPILFQDLTLTGSIGQVPAMLDGQRIYRASSDYESFPLYTFTGSQGGTLPNLITNFDEDFGFTVNQVVNVTQSWDGYNVTPFKLIPFTDSTAQEFINGEFSGSSIVATDGELNPGCEPFKVAPTTLITYNISGSFIPTFQGFVNQQNLVQGPGEIHIWWEPTIVSQEKEYAPGYFDYIWSPAAFTISKESANGIDLDDYIPSVLNYIFQTGYTSGDVTLSGWTPSYTPSYNLGNLELEVINIQEYTTSFSGTGYYLIQLAPNSYNITVLTDNPAGTVAIANKSNVLTIFEPFVPVSFENSDCNAVFGNAVLARVNPTFMDVDYPDSATVPINQQAILNGNATPSTVQTFNYNSHRSTLPRYIGSRNSDAQGTNDPGYYYGSVNPELENPFYPAQDRTNLILEFNGGGGTYPEIEKGGAVFITQLISATGPDNVTYTKQKDEGYTNIVNYTYRGYDFENFVIVNQYDGSNATVPPASSQIVLTDASVPALSNFLIPADSTFAGTGSITFTTTNQYITWNKVSSATSAIYSVTTDSNGFECTSSQVSTNDFLNTLLSGSLSGSEYYISLYRNLNGTAQGAINQVLNWPLKITGINVGSGISYLSAGIREADFRSFSIDKDLVGGNSNVGGPGSFSGVSYGALVWAADKTKRAIAVQQETGSFSGIQRGALTKPDNTVFVQQNTEYITRRFGSDPTPNVPLVQSSPRPQSPPSSNNLGGNFAQGENGGGS
jgi:hypothetical protein